ncbi:MAG: error-prone DNA polymerase [Verrucomicrobiota bacterium]
MFIELHARSAFSFHRGASQPEELIRQAATLGLPALALTDRDGFYGSARAHYASKELASDGTLPAPPSGRGPATIKALVGTEITLEDNSVLPLLVATRKGYQSLSQLLTTAKLRGLAPFLTPASPHTPPSPASKKLRVFASSRETPASLSPDDPTINPRKDSRIYYTELAQLLEHLGPGHLIALTGDEEGPVRRSLTQYPNHPTHTLEITQHLADLFGPENCYVELHRHHVRGETRLNNQLRDLAHHLRLPLLASNGPTFHTPERRLLFDAFTCLQNHTHLDDAGLLLARNSQRHLKSPEEMHNLFHHDLPEALTNTLRLADRLEFSLENLGYEFPRYPSPNDETEYQILRRETLRGAKNRYPGKSFTKKVRRQLEHEFSLIEKLGFCGYFLIVWDIVNMARDNHILVQGRGSAANSAVCYSLGITACDPIKYKLLFERFLAEGRNSWPDIDLDLPSGDQRESIIQAVYEKYAPRGAAMTANVITYRGRSAMRDMGKALNLSEDILGRFSDLFASGDFPHTLKLKEQITQSGLPKDHPRFPALIKLYQSVYRLPRHLGQHSGGMIISDQGLDSVVPLENASMEDRRVVQWDKDDCDDLGIIKVDLLGLGMLAAMEETITLCNTRSKERAVDLAHIPQDDPETFAMMQRADTIGTFQIESRAQMATLPRMRPACFYDVAVQVAIIRPGPIVGNLTHPYLDRRNGKEEITYIHDLFVPILERTLGVPLFQEQVLQMAMVIADFTGSEAEELRRAMSFHRSEERMQKAMAKLRAAMSTRDVDPEIQTKIVNAIQSFALYGFPESHAISFGLIAYASTWLKAHRPVEFYVGLLNHQPMGFYGPDTLLKDAKRHGIRIRPVSVVSSEFGASVENDTTLRLGLNQIKSLPEATAERLLLQRACHPFTNHHDFLKRVRPNKKERRLLAQSGALNDLPDINHRRDALWQTEHLPDPDDLFSTIPNSQFPIPNSEAPLRPMSPLERLHADYSTLALTTGPHPMAHWRAHQKELTTNNQQPITAPYRAIDLHEVSNNATITIGGQVICRQRPGTAKGHMFISLEDETGIANAFVPAPTFEKYRLTITQEPFLLIRGRLQHIDHALTLYTHHIQALPFQTPLPTQSHDFH